LRRKAAIAKSSNGLEAAAARVRRLAAGLKSLFLPPAKPTFAAEIQSRRPTCRPVDTEDRAMGAWGIQHWLVVLVVVLILFGGRGKISSLMGDFAQGIKAFKKGMSSEDEAAKTEPAKTEPAKTIDHQTAQASPQPQTEPRKVG
jgi:sec-independent protein translocase protein TatA